jgi:hypothetical protein
MKFELRPRDRRALIGLAVAFAIYVVLSLIVFPAFDMLATGSAEATAKEEELMKYRRAQIRKGHYAQLLEQARKSMAEAESRLVRGDNPSLASVELQTIVEESAKKVAIELGARSMSAPRKKDDFFNEITMTLAFDCTPNQLVTFLSEIRSSPKSISIRSAQVVPVQVVHAAPPKGDLMKTLRVNLMLSAILSSPPVAVRPQVTQ